jgi:2-polyprenyl-3-methyl-5-hydroxy-6-metoxy-1,4-benzoquinol methylase
MNKAESDQRDIDDYTKLYLVENFEDLQVKYRRKKILDEMSRYKHRVILEIGCGMEPLFKYIDPDEYDKYVIVEPSEEFYRNALEIKNDKVTIIKDFFGSDRLNLDKYEFDFVICASLLHEILDEYNFMQTLHNVCNEKTVVHINVPNADSMHRHLAKCMGIIEDEHEMSQRNIDFQQSRVYDLQRLMQVSRENDFSVIDSGSFFIKPFTHAQMYQCIEKGIIDDTVLEGLYNMSGGVYSQIGSELFVDLKIN